MAHCVIYLLIGYYQVSWALKLYNNIYFITLLGRLSKINKSNESAYHSAWYTTLTNVRYYCYCHHCFPLCYNRHATDSAQYIC